MTSPSAAPTDRALASELSCLIEKLAAVNKSQDVSPYRDFIWGNRQRLESMLGEDGWSSLSKLADTAIYPTACIVQARDARERAGKARKNRDWKAEKEANEMAEEKEKNRESCEEDNRKRRSDGQALLIPFLRRNRGDD